jgi:hypothetical protein
MAAKKKPAAKTPKKAEQAAPPAPQSFDASAAASSAAAFLANRVKTPAATGGNESASFKKLKAGLGQPASSPFGAAVKSGPATGQTTSAFKPQSGGSPAGGPNVARTGVPRRTSGG